MRKSTRRRPELESLESLMLLSTVVVHHAAAITLASPIPLTGTLHTNGIQFSKPMPLGNFMGKSLGSISEVSGSGSLNKLGSTKMVLEGSAGNDQYILGLVNKHSYIALAAQISLPARGAPTTAEYFVIDGNDKLATEINPSGTITISQVTPKGGKPSYSIKLS